MPCSTADAIRGTATAVVVGVWSTLLPASELLHHFGYYAAIATLLLGLRFGLRAIGMLFVCCIAIAVAGATAGRGAARQARTTSRAHSMLLSRSSSSVTSSAQ